MPTDEVFPRSPYVASSIRGADRLVVLFCPAGTPAGKFPRLLKSPTRRYDVLAFNAPDSQWYVDGIPETAGQPGRFEQALSAFIGSGGYRRVLFCGASKGAFGAVDFGLRCGANSILVTGLESLYGLCAMFRAVVPPALAIRQRRRLGEWPSLARASPARIHSFYGVESVSDLLYAWVAPRRLGAKALVLARAGHFLPPAIEARAGLTALIDDILERDGLAGLEQSLADLDLDRIGRAAVAYVQGTDRRRHRPAFRPGLVPRNEAERYVVAAALQAQKRPRAALRLLEAPYGAVIGETAWQTLRARALLDAGEARAAEPIARRLHEADPTSLEPAQLLHRALLRSGRTGMAAALAIGRFRADPKRPGLLESSLRQLMASGRKEKAAALLQGELRGKASAAQRTALLAMAARLALPLPVRTRPLMPASSTTSPTPS
ncbi:MAG: hypothetical protein M0002_08510 [Rhodospirillales bacterium]|nr:hypothetical protein [Rhodospirillales bacterium]